MHPRPLFRGGEYSKECQVRGVKNPDVSKGVAKVGGIISSSRD